jgi:hypothetical protein
MPESSSFRSRVRRFTLVVVLADGGLPSRGESSTRAELADRTTIGPRPVSCSLLQDGGPAHGTASPRARSAAPGKYVNWPALGLSRP